MINSTQIDIQAKFLRSLAEKNRLKILQCLRSGEKTVNEIVTLVKGSQSNISQHLACLRGCGVIQKWQRGKYCYYSLASIQIGALLNMLEVIMDDIGFEVSCCQLNKTSIGDAS